MPGLPDPFEMLSDGSGASFRRAERAFELHQRAVTLREHARPVTPDEIPDMVAMGQWAVFHPSFSREIANTSLLAMAGICDHLAHRLSPGLFETD